jgi:hypothetical protein
MTPLKARIYKRQYGWWVQLPDRLAGRFLSFAEAVQFLQAAIWRNQHPEIWK